MPEPNAPMREMVIVQRDELVKHLVMLPPDADVVIDLGRIRADVVEIVGLTYGGECDSIVIKPHPDDVRDVFKAHDSACRMAAETS